MADEKTNPTPKVARTDTMHSTPETPDRARGEGDQTGVADNTAPPSAPGTVGSETPGKQVIKTKDAGTLVTDIPDMREENAGEPEVVNPGQDAPDVVARQPSETRDDAGDRIKADTKASKSASSRSASTRSSKSSDKDK